MPLLAHAARVLVPPCFGGIFSAVRLGLGSSPRSAGTRGGSVQLVFPASGSALRPVFGALIQTRILGVSAGVGLPTRVCGQRRPSAGTFSLRPAARLSSASRSRALWAFRPLFWPCADAGVPPGCVPSVAAVSPRALPGFRCARRFRRRPPRLRLVCFVYCFVAGFPRAQARKFPTQLDLLARLRSWQLASI